jgi:hypothetical protein
MKIVMPIFIRKTEKRGYEVTGRLEGYGTIRKYGRSEQEAKERFFEACNGVGKLAVLPRRHERRASHYSPG